MRNATWGRFISGAGMVLFLGFISCAAAAPALPAIPAGLADGANHGAVTIYRVQTTVTNPATAFTNGLVASPEITLDGNALTISNSLRLDPSSVINFVVGTNAVALVVAGDLDLGGRINVSAGAGFTNGTYTLFTYGAGLAWGPPVLGATPPGYACTLDTHTPGQVNLVVRRRPAPPTGFGIIRE